MDNKHFYMAGIIQQKQNDQLILGQYMKSTINTIKSGIKNKFLKDNKNNIYVYYRYNEQKRIFNIFVTFYKINNTHYKSKDITYLITVEKEYPEKAPKVFCLTDFSEKLDIFNMKNLQKNIIEQWKTNNSVNDLISELYTFSDSLIFQAENKLLPNFGEYSYNSYIYDLNDFLMNPNNIFFRVYYLSNYEKSNDIYKNERYMIITKSMVLFLSSKNDKIKNQCAMEYKFELLWIESLKQFKNKKYPEFTFFEFQWNNHSNYLYQFVFGTKADKTVVNKINDIIIDRKRYLINNFQFFEKFNDNDVATLEKIIKIKEAYLNKVFTGSLYCQIHKIYRNIINIYNSMNDDGYKIYIEKLQQFIAKYEKIKKSRQIC